MSINHLMLNNDFPQKVEVDELKVNGNISCDSIEVKGEPLEPYYGAFSPQIIIAGSVGTPVVNFATGLYHKIGKIAVVDLEIKFLSDGAGGSQIQIVIDIPVEPLSATVSPNLFCVGSAVPIPSSAYASKLAVVTTNFESGGSFNRYRVVFDTLGGATFSSPVEFNARFTLTYVPDN